VPKTFYTERDIIDMAERGVKSLEVSDNVVLTDLARDEALKRGLRLVHARGKHVEDDSQAELIHRVKAGVIARLGDQVDAAMLDAVIARVVQGMK
jgi:delta-aminolevulinic acid dehydratase/porphobilinogen synthase